MMLKHAFTAVAAFGVLAAPLTAQVHQHTPPAQQAPTAKKAPAPAKSPAPAKTAAPKAGAMEGHAMGGMQGMDMSDMVCTMGMLPHGEMGGMGGMQHGQGGMGGMMGGGMMGGMKQPMGKPDSMKHEGMAGMKHEGMGGGMSHPVTPLMLVHHAKDLSLTEAQVAAFTKAGDAAKTSCQAHMKEAMAAHMAALPMLNADTPNLAGYEGKLKEATTHMVMAHMAVVKAGADARASLTAAQRQKLAELAKSEHGK